MSIADEVPFEIPETWEWVRLGQVVFNRGQCTPQEDFCYIDIGSINNKQQCLNSEETVLSADKAPSRARKLVAIGDILYSTVRPYLHNMCIIDRSFSRIPIASTGFAVMTCHSDFYNKYLFYYLMSPDFDAYANDTDNAKGVAYPAINDDRLYRALIPIPPVSEQHRIVAKIESLKDALNEYGFKETELRTLNNSFPEQLKKSILQMAIQGKLVPQDPADEPASVLLERIRAEKQRLVAEGKIKRVKHESVIFRRDNSHYEKLDGTERCIDDEIPFELPDTWAWARIKTISTVIVDCPHSTPKYYSEDTGFYSIDTTCINSDGTIQGFRYVDEQAYMSRIARLSPRTGDIVYTREGSIGRAAVLPDVNQVCLGQRVMLLRLSALVDTALYQQVLMSPVVLDPITGKTRGIGAKHINVSDVCNALVPVPPMEEQRRILAALSTVIPILKTI